MTLGKVFGADRLGSFDVAPNHGLQYFLLSFV
jgi:hypothetical protein